MTSCVTMTTMAGKMEKVAEVVKKRISLSLRKRKRIEDSLHPIVSEDDKEDQPPEDENLTPVVSEGDQEQNQPPNNRFASPVRDEVMMKDKLGLQANQWALRNFTSWSDMRNKKYDEQVPPDLLGCHDATVVCKWLCCFVQETRKEDGQPYPPRSLKQLLCGLKRIMDSNRVPFNV